MFIFQRIVAVAGMLLGFSTMGSASGIITFNELRDGDIVSNQYLPGVIFTPGISGVSGLTNPSGPGIGFATNTSLKVTSTNVGNGVKNPLSGLLLHSFDGWLSENGDAAFTIDFANPIIAIQIDFLSVSLPGSAIYAVNGSNAVIASAAAVAPGTSTVILNPSVPVTRFIVTMGTMMDWVGVDNIAYTALQITPHQESTPEPSSFILLTAGTGALVLLRRRTRRQGTPLT